MVRAHVAAVLLEDTGPTVAEDRLILQCDANMGGARRVHAARAEARGHALVAAKALEHVPLAIEMSEFLVVRHNDSFVQPLKRALLWRVAVVTVAIRVFPTLT